MMETPSDPIDIVKEKGWLKISDKSQLEALCKEVMDKNKDKVRKRT